MKTEEKKSETENAEAIVVQDCNELTTLQPVSETKAEENENGAAR
jgi:hypothetical protein